MRSKAYLVRKIKRYTPYLNRLPVFSVYVTTAIVFWLLNGFRGPVLNHTTLWLLPNLSASLLVQNGSQQQEGRDCNPRTWLLRCPRPRFSLWNILLLNKGVLFHAKSWVKEGHFAFAWTREGRILIRKTSSYFARKVKHLSEVDIVGHPNSGSYGEAVGAQDGAFSEGATAQPEYN